VVGLGAVQFGLLSSSGPCGVVSHWSAFHSGGLGLRFVRVPGVALWGAALCGVAWALLHPVCFLCAPKRCVVWDGLLSYLCLLWRVLHRAFCLCLVVYSVPAGSRASQSSARRISTRQRPPYKVARAALWPCANHLLHLKVQQISLSLSLYPSTPTVWLSGVAWRPAGRSICDILHSSPPPSP